MQSIDKTKKYLRVIHLKNVDSTNNYTLNLAVGGVREITVVYADSQTNGKGRRNNSWVSPCGGLYISFLLRPKNLLSNISSFPLYFALGAINGLSKAVDARIKHPNDIMVNNKKIGGVLVESRIDGQTIDFVIVGIGLNINSRKNELPESATSLYLETGTIHSIDQILKQTIKEILILYTKIKNGNIEELNKQIPILDWQKK